MIFLSMDLHQYNAQIFTDVHFTALRSIHWSLPTTICY
jgi:hypothetical protein